MPNESKKERNRRRMAELNSAKELKREARDLLKQARKESKKLDEFIDDLEEAVEEDEGEENEGEPAWKSFKDKPQWDKFDEGLPPGLAKKDEDEENG